MGKFKKFLGVLTETSLSRKNFKDNPDRFDTFKHKIQKGEPFASVDGKEMIIDKEILKVLTNTPGSIPSKIQTNTGVVSLSAFHKTKEFGSNTGSGGGATSTTINESAQCLYCAMVDSGDIPTAANMSANFKKYSKLCDVNATEDDMLSIGDRWVNSSINIAKFINTTYGSGFKYHRGSKLVALIEAKFTELNGIAGRPLKNVNKWNPADIWLVKNPTNIANEIKKITTLVSLNVFIAKKYKDNELVGISLKKTSGNSVPFKVYNEESIATKIKYNGYRVTNKGGFLSDAIDVYLEFFYGENNSVQFRNFGGKALNGWQGEVSGGEAKGGKIGGGIVAGIVKRYSGKTIPKSSDVAKLTKSRDAEFLKEFYELSTKYYVMTKAEFDKKIVKTSDQYIYSKYLGLKLVTVIEESSKKDLIISNIIGYAISSTVDSSVFAKIGK